MHEGVLSPTAAWCSTPRTVGYSPPLTRQRPSRLDKRLLLASAFLMSISPRMDLGPNRTATEGVQPREDTPAARGPLRSEPGLRGLAPSSALDEAAGQCMAVKTITIDLEAYQILARRKRPGQSFSQVIKEGSGASRKGRELRVILGRLRMSPEALDSIERQVRRRGEAVRSAVDLTGAGTTAVRCAPDHLSR